MEHLYSNRINNKKVVIIGSVPPPLGGVSVHISRVAQKFKDQGNRVGLFKSTQEYRYRFFCFYALRLLFFILWWRPDFVYYHSLYLTNALSEVAVIIFIKRFLRFKYIIVEHNCRYLNHRPARFKKKLNKYLNKVDTFICMGNNTLKSCGANLTLPQKTSCEAAFLPPNIDKQKELINKFPKELIYFLKNYNPILLANASQTTLYKGSHLYGFDRCVKALIALKETYPHIGLVLAMPCKGAQEFCKNLLKDIGINDQKNIFFLFEQYQLWPLFKKVDLFLRPTLSDGASVSLQEALFFNIPSVASNVCQRPKGTNTFKVDSFQDFVNTITEVLQKRKNNALQYRYMHKKQTKRSVKSS